MSVEVLANKDEDIVSLKIVDTGIGIADEDMKHLFQPFIQIDSKLSRQYAGTGLGLALVSRLVMLHGGGITVESQPDEGSCFTVSLPLAGPRFVDDLNGDSPLTAENQVVTSLHVPPSASKNTNASQNGAHQEPLVLLIDDNESVVNILLEYLLGRGYRVMVVRDGIEAIERVRDEKPILVLVDINLSGLGGIDAIHQLKTELEGSHIPIVALSGLLIPSDEKRCLTAGATAYLSKPIRLPQLANILEAL